MRNVCPLGVSLQGTCEASVDPGCSRSRVMGGSSQKELEICLSFQTDHERNFSTLSLNVHPSFPQWHFELCVLTSGGIWAQWVWERKIGWCFLKPLDSGGILSSPHSWKEWYFWLFVRSEPRVRLNMQLPFETSDIYAESGSKVAMTHSTGLVTMSWGHDASRGMRELWCPIWLAASRAGHPGAERVLERFSPWRKDKTFKLPNKLFQVFVSKNREIKKKKSSTGNKVRLKGYTVIYHQGLYSLGHFAVMLEVSRIPSAYGVQESKSKKRKLLPWEWSLEKCRPERCKVLFQSLPPLRPLVLTRKISIVLRRTKTDQQFCEEVGRTE